MNYVEVKEKKYLYKIAIHLKQQYLINSFLGIVTYIINYCTTFLVVVHRVFMGCYWVVLLLV